MKQKIEIRKTCGFYKGYEIFQAKNGYFFALSTRYDDVDGCETIEECKEDIDMIIEAMS